MSVHTYNLLIFSTFSGSSDQNRTVHWKDSCRLHVPLYNTSSLKAAPLDLNIFQKTEKNSSTTEIQVRINLNKYCVYQV